MKKFVSGIIVGLLLFSGASVFADSVSLVGQKVQGLFSVEKSGKKIADAVIINGSTYAPVRAIAEATGAKLDVKGKTIIVQESSSNVVDSSEVTQPAEQVVTKEDLTSAIDKKKEQIKVFNEVNINTWESMISENPKSSSIPMWQTALEKANTQLQKLEAELADLQSQLTALQK
ncbi:hypothetical protein [Paenibacillus sp. IHBB 3054]|uniref:hypothetical protein n=1 Tax=Paenibacillus sp. IHBB 3054 TaxID=3425689 RepID=UPI003F667A15